MENAGYSGVLASQGLGEKPGAEMDRKGNLGKSHLTKQRMTADMGGAAVRHTLLISETWVGIVTFGFPLIHFVLNLVLHLESVPCDEDPLSIQFHESVVFIAFFFSSTIHLMR